MTDTTTNDTLRMPAPDCPVLTGLAQIAAWRGLTIGQTRAAIARGEIQVFKITGGTTTFALKDDQIELWRDKAKKHKKPKA